MFYREELSFLREVFHRRRIRTALVDREAFFTLLSKEREEIEFRFHSPLPLSLPELLPKTLYKTTDAFAFCYCFFLLPDTDRPTVFYIGPYLAEPLSHQQQWLLGEKNGISPQKQRYLSEYYEGTPILAPDGALATMLNTFCERLWGSSFSVVDVSAPLAVSEAPASRSMLDSSHKDTLLSMKAMEQRYAFENQMIRAVEMGRPYMEEQLRAFFSANLFERRTQDVLRNAKNYGIIMNTLLRKAAERGGVHPIYLDRTSSDFASRIENLPSVSEIPELMSEMFRTYCRLVRSHSMQSLSPVVQKTVIIVDADLSADLSPSTLAANLGITLGYLSTVFRKEMGKTVSEYVRQRRMEYAMYLLSTTDLQTQTVALHCGILDAQYFSKLFKRHTDMTPTEYRLSHRGGANKISPKKDDSLDR